MTAVPDENRNLNEALTLARLGYRVLPIKPGDKRPPMPAWQDAATTDENRITSWWTGLYRNYGVGIATGQWNGKWLFVVDVDEHGEVSGSDTLYDLESRHNALRGTVEALTGSGGRHLYLTSPHPIRNDAGRRMGPGIDIRGEGGQVLAPPTIHPNGNRYEWVDGQEPWNITPQPAPQWLLDLLTERPKQAPTEAPRTRDEFLNAGPIDRFNEQTRWADILAPDGWVIAQIGADGEAYWTRPGKADGISATTGWNGQDFLRVFTTSVPWLPEGAYSKIQYIAARDHAGDIRAALRAVRPTNQVMASDGAETTTDDETSWEDRDLSGWLDGTHEDVVPTMLERTDGQALIYPGRINLVFGESGSGKSWVALNAAAQLIAQHRHVAYVDLEDHPRTMTRRLMHLGAQPDDIVKYLHYKQPHIASKTYAVNAMEELVNTVHAELVIVDSYGEALALFGVDQNDDQGVATFTQAVLRPWTRMGISVVLLDHIPKSEEGPRLFAIGSQRKRAAVDGAAYRINQVKSFGKGVDGKLTVVSAKDRGGTYPLGSIVAEIEVKTDPEGDLRLVVNPPEERDGDGIPRRPTSLMEKISRFLEDRIAEQLTITEIRKEVRGQHQAKMRALAVLVEEGFVNALQVEPEGAKPRTVYNSHRPFRVSQDAENDLVFDTHRSNRSNRSKYDGNGGSDPQNTHRSNRSPSYTYEGNGNGGYGLTGTHRSEPFPQNANLTDGDDDLF